LDAEEVGEAVDVVEVVVLVWAGCAVVAACGCAVVVDAACGCAVVAADCGCTAALGRGVGVRGVDVCALIPIEKRAVQAMMKPNFFMVVFLVVLTIVSQY